MKNILIVGRGAAGQRYLDLIKLIDPSVIVDIYDRKKAKRWYDYIIISSSTENHFNDFVQFSGSSNTFLLEKPIVTDAVQLAELDKIVKDKKLEIFTGDQFFFSDLICKIMDIMEEKWSNVLECEIIYTDLEKNVTKGNTKSFFYDYKSGGVLYTFSHAYFVFQMILKGLYPILMSVKNQHVALNSENYVERNVESKWLVDNRVPVKICTNVIGNNLQFNVIIKTNLEYWSFDLIAGKFKKGNSTIYMPKNSRQELIQRCIMNFLEKDKFDQYGLSKAALSNIWKIKKCL